MKRFATVMLALALVLSMVSTACAMTLRPGEKGDDVKDLQRALNKTGLFTLKVDGVYGPATTNAVKLYQGMYDLKVDGKAGPKTLNQLGYTGSVSPIPSEPNTHVVLRLGAKGTQVRLLQQALIDLGYPVGSADNVYGPKTYRAVVLFQQINGLTVDGKAGPQTLNCLYGGAALVYSEENSGSNYTPAE